MVAPSEPGNAARSIDQLLDHLRAGGHRVTTSRRELIRSLVEAGGHRTADELASDVQRRAPDVHISTIYRNLEELERLGIVEHAHLGHGAATYHLGAVAHGHLVCSDCGTMIEVPDSWFQALAKRAKTTHGFTLDPHHFAMIGRCSACNEGVER